MGRRRDETVQTAIFFCIKKELIGATLPRNGIREVLVTTRMFSMYFCVCFVFAGTVHILHLV